MMIGKPEKQQAVMPPQLENACGVAPGQQSINDFELPAASKTLQPEEHHQAFPDKGGTGIPPAMPANGDELYSRLFCCAFSLKMDDIFPSDHTCSCYEGFICLQSHSTCGFKSEEPFISSTAACELIMPKMLLDYSCKFCPIKLGCDLGTKLGDKCAKPLVICCKKQVV
jgi:hypothetical protein